MASFKVDYSEQTMNRDAKYRLDFQGIYGLLLCALLFTSSAQAANVGELELKERIKLGEANLYLNGAGQRTKLFIDLYIAALYLPDKSHDAQAIIDANEVMLIQIHVISNLINSDTLTQGTMEGFNKSTGHQTEAIQGLIDDFLGAFQEPIVIGDTFEMVYQPGKGVTVVKNRHIIKTIADNQAFKRALFGIWLSDKPAQFSLKENLLGR
jgi:hypothetical protein